MRRVLVIGICGAGKSTFSRALAGKTGLPPVHLDKEYWKPGWTKAPKPQWRARVAELVAAERWIIDGNFGGSLHLRLPRAVAVFWFDYPPLRCLRRVLWRKLVHHGRVRKDMGAGCPERIDLEFLRYVWRFNANSLLKARRRLRRAWPPSPSRHIPPRRRGPALPSARCPDAEACPAETNRLVTWLGRHCEHPTRSK